MTARDERALASVAKWANSDTYIGDISHGNSYWASLAEQAAKRHVKALLEQPEAPEKPRRKKGAAMTDAKVDPPAVTED